MKRKWVLAFVVCMVFILTSCVFPPHSNYLPSGTAKALTAAATTSPAIETATTVPSMTSELPTPTAIPPTPTVIPSTPTMMAVQLPVNLAFPPDISASVYLDDRSTAEALIQSYYNAINRQEYLRAYSYWGDPANTVGSFDKFMKGYLDTDSVNVVTGQVSGEGAAGTNYYTVPVVLNVITTDQAKHKYVACYVLRMPQPGNYGAPPISPMNIFRGTAKAIDLNKSDKDGLSVACTGPDYPTNGYGTSPVMETLTDISPANYIDKRSGALELISSYFNALNRMEIVRAYSYWKNPIVYSDFEAGYIDWGQVSEVIFGETMSDAGAGQMYYQTPVVFSRTLAGGTTQIESACFVMHLSQPTFQATPPFNPLGITSLTFGSGAASTDPVVLLTSVCPQP